MGPDLGKAANAGDFEWVNAWASNAQAPAQASPPAAAPASAPADAVTVEAAPAGVPDDVLSHDIAEIRAVQAATNDAPHLVLVSIAPQSPEQLMRDIVDIEQARDALQAERLFLQAEPKRTHAFMLVPSRTADTVPVFVGGVLALMMLTVFGAAAMVSKLAR
jgi:hypothetical protein